MSTLSARLKRLEKRFPSRRYDPNNHVTTFHPDAKTLRGALEGAIVAGLMPLMTDDELEALIQTQLRRNRHG